MSILRSSRDRTSSPVGDAGLAAPFGFPPAEGAAIFFRPPVQLSDEALTMLAVVCAHDRMSPADFLARAICARAQAIGLPDLLQGREVASRLAHTQEAGRSIRPPATSITTERRDQGGGGHPAAPACASSRCDERN